MPKFIDLAGQKFGKLSPIKIIGKDKWGNYLWSCICDCDEETVVTGTDLKNGHTKSCGCLKIKHKHTLKGKKSKTYKSWDSMIQRCTNPKNTNYKNYGGKNPPITVCYRWLPKNNGFINFLADMKEKPTNKHQIDRINNNLGYFKENCRWVLPKTNSRNKSNNLLIPFNGKELCPAEWEEITGIKRHTIYSRITLGWSIEDTLTVPTRKYNRKL